MEKPKLYFGSNDKTRCYPLEYHMDNAIDEELQEITLVEAIPDNKNKEFIWCSNDSEVTERYLCKKSECESYYSKSGRGICQYRGNLYEHGKEVTFKVEQ